MRYGMMAALGAVVMVAAPAAAQEGGPGPVAMAAEAEMLSADETLWHVRAALNVAALECRGIGDAGTAAAYGALLDADRVILAAAHAGVQARYRLRRGVQAADAAYDDDMTRLYNHYAQPPARDEFCATARAVLDDARRVAAAEMGRFAPAALAALEAPFRRGGASMPREGEGEGGWRVGPGRVVIATAAPVPVGPPLGPDGR